MNSLNDINIKDLINSIIYEMKYNYELRKELREILLDENVYERPQPRVYDYPKIYMRDSWYGD